MPFNFGASALISCSLGADSVFVTFGAEFSFSLVGVDSFVSFLAAMVFSFFASTTFSGFGASFVVVVLFLVHVLALFCWFWSLLALLCCF